MAFAMAKDKFVDVACMELSDVKLLNILTLPETQVIKIIPPKSGFLPFFQNESWCTTFQIELSLIRETMNEQEKLISLLNARGGGYSL